MLASMGCVCEVWVGVEVVEIQRGNASTMLGTLINLGPTLDHGWEPPMGPFPLGNAQREGLL